MNPNFLMQIANKVYDISDVTEKTNTQSNVYARTAVSFYMRLNGNTLGTIGKLLNKDHSSICYQLNKHQDHMKYNPVYKKLFETYQTELQKPINKEDYVKSEVRKMVQQLFDLKMTSEQIEDFWNECITEAKQIK